jgi:hypothetical protein
LIANRKGGFGRVALADESAAQLRCATLGAVETDREYLDASSDDANEASGKTVLGSWECRPAKPNDIVPSANSATLLDSKATSQNLRPKIVR